MMDRRAFLARTGALVLGYPFLQWQDQPRGVLDEALARIREQNKTGVWIVLPTAPAGRAKIADALAREIENGNLVFAEAVFACVEAAEIHGERETFQACIVDSDGKRLETFETLDFKQIESSVAKHRARQAERCRQLVGEARAEIERAFALLADDDPAVRERATAELRRHLERIVPLVRRRGEQTQDPETRSRCAGLIKDHFESATRKAPGPQLPFGARWVKEKIDPCPRCGRMMSDPRARVLLRFLKDPD